MMALKRLYYLKTKMTKNEDYQQEYKKFMTDMVTSSYAEEVKDINTAPDYTWYIPHFGVFHPQKQKVRVVYDCAARINGLSLNDFLMKGPDLTNTLLSVLTRFRLGTYACTADIKKMFYQVKVPVSDRDYLRFLWWKNADYNAEPSIYRMCVHLFGATSSPSIATYALQRTAKDNKSFYSGKVIDSIMENFYVDDFLKATNNELLLTDIAAQTREAVSRGGFELEKFASNTGLPLKHLPEEVVNQDVLDALTSGKSLPNQMILGVNWDMNEDVLKVNFSINTVPTTRRTLLRQIASVYDPLGMVAPSVMEGRIILQETCKLKMTWDDQFSQELKKKVRDWHQELIKVPDIVIKRNIIPLGDLLDLQLHVFADASQVGYGAVAYLRTSIEQKTECHFLMGKARVTPLKAVTIPRLELAAAVLAVKMKKALIDILQLELSKINLWSDSTTVLCYINNDTAKYKTFVANRLSIIKDGSRKDEWRYVPSEYNPADEASRGRQTKLWLHGPSFLREDCSLWPGSPLNVHGVSNCDPEIKYPTTVHALEVKESPTRRLLTSFSDWFKLKKSVAWILAYFKFLKNKTLTTSLSLFHLLEAEYQIIRAVQRASFSEEIKQLLQGNCVSPRSSLYRLKPFIDDRGLLRVMGRIGRSDVTFELKHPIIMPHNHHVTDLIIRQSHLDAGHMGRCSVLSRVREKYWIIKGNKAVRKVIGQCVKCKKTKGPGMIQQMSDLPTTSVTKFQPPFSNTGLDCFGPFYTKRGRSQVKRYGLVFVCLNIRAIHIEMLEDMTTGAFINGLRRFLARRGSVQTLRSDQGTNFVGASRELKQCFKELDFKIIGEDLLKKDVEWVFNTPQASHHGGIWERQIRTIRSVLLSVITEQILTDDSLTTLFCEIEQIVNNRPLTTVSNDENDLIPLSPSQILTLKSTFISPPVSCDSRSSVQIKWKQVQYLAELFWTRWVREYFVFLQFRQKWLRKTRNLTVGDIVLMIDSQRPRNKWPLAIVTSVKISDDGLVRSATLKSNGLSYTRPISKLVMILEGDS